MPDPSKQAAFDRYCQELDEKREAEGKQQFAKVIGEAGFQGWELQKIADAELKMRAVEEEEAE